MSRCYKCGALLVPCDLGGFGGPRCGTLRCADACDPEDEREHEHEHYEAEREEYERRREDLDAEFGYR